jgi:predicted GIY-YIG superfamily endonuclease
MHYVYILQSKSNLKFYTATSQDLRRRLSEHNSDNKKFTSWSGPYELIWYCAFVNKVKAYEFEKYLKSSSGSALRNKRLI